MIEQFSEKKEELKAQLTDSSEIKTRKEGPMDFARDVKKLIADKDHEKALFYNHQLLQIINAYDDVKETSSVESEVARDATIYTRLSELANRIVNSKDDNLIDVIHETIDSVNLLHDTTTVSSSLDILNNIASSIDDCCDNLKLKDLESLENKLTKSYIQAVTSSLDEDNKSINNVPSTYKNNIINYITAFRNKINVTPVNGNEEESKNIAENLKNISIDDRTQEQKIISSIKLIKDRNLLDEFLGRDREKQSVKVKEVKKV